MQFLISCAAVAVVAAALALTLDLLPPLRAPHRPRRARPGGARARIGLVAVLLLAAALVCGAWLGWFASLSAGGLLWVVALVFLRWSRRWRPAAHASWSLTVLAGAAYVVAMAAWTASRGLGGLAAAGAWVLWVAGVVAFVLYLSYGYDLHDTLGTRHDAQPDETVQSPGADPASRSARRRDARDTRAAVWPRAGASLTLMGAAGAAAAVLWFVVQPATTTQATGASSGAPVHRTGAADPVDLSTLPTFATTGVSTSPPSSATTTRASRTERRTASSTTSTSSAATATSSAPAPAPTTAVPTQATTKPNGKPIKPKPTGGPPPVPSWTIPPLP
jgi:hypothetical protein